MILTPLRPIQAYEDQMKIEGEYKKREIEKRGKIESTIKEREYEKKSGKGEHEREKSELKEFAGKKNMSLFVKKKRGRESSYGEAASSCTLVQGNLFFH